MVERAVQLTVIERGGPRRRVDVCGTGIELCGLQDCLAGRAALECALRKGGWPGNGGS